MCVCVCGVCVCVCVCVCVWCGVCVVCLRGVCVCACVIGLERGAQEVRVLSCHCNEIMCTELESNPYLVGEEDNSKYGMQSVHPTQSHRMYTSQCFLPSFTHSSPLISLPVSSPYSTHHHLSLLCSNPTPLPPSLPPFPPLSLSPANNRR